MSQPRPRKSPDRWVLVPGTLCTPAVFEPLLAELRVPPQSQVFIDVDLPQVGDYAPHLSKTVRRGDIVCGFSLGALVLAHNLEAVRQAKAIILLALNPFADRPGGRQRREQTRDMILAGGAKRWFTENWATLSTDTGTELLDKAIGMAEASSSSIAAQTELAASRPGAFDQIIAEPNRVLLVTGENDRLTPVGHVQQIPEQSKNATLKQIPKLGHFALLEAPDLVAREIELWL